MNKFLVQSLGFLILVVILAFVAPLLPDMNQNSSMVFALTDKHKILEKLESPKVILLGGSNISFGTNTTNGFARKKYLRLGSSCWLRAKVYDG
jgi:hypothetical protein